MRFVGVTFNVYITGKIGAAGMGLYSLIMSVGGFAITFAVSGVNLAATKLTAEALGHDSPASVRSAMKRCICYSLMFGITAQILLLLLSEPISLKLLCDKRSIVPLRILSVSLPFISLSSALNGYFTAVRRVLKSASAQIFEQFVFISVTVYTLGRLAPKGTEYACIAIIGGATIAEFLSLAYSILMYRLDLKKHNKNTGIIEKNLTRRLLNISIPVALSTYVRSGLLTVEHLLIPYGLKKSGSSSDKALAAYGTLHGMVMPVILFPHAFLGAFSGLLVPELAESSARGENARINNIVTRVFQITLAFSVGVSGIMLCYSYEIGNAIYKSAEASDFIRLMAPLIPVMYLDNVVDGMLKGLGEQLYSMRVNIVDSFLSVILVYLMLPHWGIYGYIIIIYVMEIINASLSICRLLRRTDINVQLIKWLAKPLLCIIGATSCTRMIMSVSQMQVFNYNILLVLNISITVIIYIAFLRFTWSLNNDDIKWIKSVVK